MTAEDREETIKRIQDILIASRRLGGFSTNEIRFILKYLKEQNVKLREDNPRRGALHEYSRTLERLPNLVPTVTKADVVPKLDDRVARESRMAIELWREAECLALRPHTFDALKQLPELRQIIAHTAVRIITHSTGGVEQLAGVIAPQQHDRICVQDKLELTQDETCLMEHLAPALRLILAAEVAAGMLCPGQPPPPDTPEHASALRLFLASAHCHVVAEMKSKSSSSSKSPPTAFDTPGSFVKQQEAAASVPEVEQAEDVVNVLLQQIFDQSSSGSSRLTCHTGNGANELLAAQTGQRPAAQQFQQLAWQAVLASGGWSAAVEMVNIMMMHCMTEPRLRRAAQAEAFLASSRGAGGGWQSQGHDEASCKGLMKVLRHHGLSQLGQRDALRLLAADRAVLNVVTKYFVDLWYGQGLVDETLASGVWRDCWLKEQQSGHHGLRHKALLGASGGSSGSGGSPSSFSSPAVSWTDPFMWRRLLWQLLGKLNPAAQGFYATRLMACPHCSHKEVWEEIHASLCRSLWSPPDANLVQLQLSSLIDEHNNTDRAARVRSYAQVLNEAYLKDQAPCRVLMAQQVLLGLSPLHHSVLPAPETAGLCPSSFKLYATGFALRQLSDAPRLQANTKDTEVEMVMALAAHYFDLQTTIVGNCLLQALLDADARRGPPGLQSAASAATAHRKQQFQKLVQGLPTVVNTPSLIVLERMIQGPPSLLATAQSSSRGWIASDSALQGVQGRVCDHLKTICDDRKYPEAEQQDEEFEGLRVRTVRSGTVYDLFDSDNTDATQLLLHGPVPVGALLPQEAWWEHQQQLLGASLCGACSPTIAKDQEVPCPECMVTVYCSKQCLLKDTENHQALCSELRSAQQRYAASAAGRHLELLLLVPEVGEPPLFANNKAGLEGLLNTLISPDELSTQCMKLIKLLHSDGSSSEDIPAEIISLELGVD
eukprot:gene7198-7412_t